MTTTAYADPSNPDCVFAVVRAPRREPAYFPVRIREGSRMRKRIAASECPPRPSFQQATEDLDKLAALRGWKIAGTVDVD